MVILFSQARGLPVVTAGEAAELGTVDALTIDASAQSISHLRLSGTRAKGHAVLAWDLVRTVGQDAVIAHCAPTAETTPTAAPAHREALGSRVLTDLGDEHGSVKDIAFDPTTGHIHTLYTTRGPVPGPRLIGLGDYALVVRAHDPGHPG
ncbi:hypothetical protein AB0K71_09355 [Streptomyces syringium]|uniref:hypothetical protein n=1 Tax=Streptomyces syringium TaxID=76729 RepID=UPI0033A72C1D